MKIKYLCVQLEKKIFSKSFKKFSQHSRIPSCEMLN